MPLFGTSCCYSKRTKYIKIDICHFCGSIIHENQEIFMCNDQSFCMEQCKLTFLTEKKPFSF